MTDIHFSLKIQTEPSLEPVSTADAKAHLRVDVANDDTLIDGFVAAARIKFEGDTNRALITQTWDLYLDRFPDNGEGIKLPRYPVQSVIHIKYYDSDGIEKTWSSDNYIVDEKSKPARITLAYGSVYPTTRGIVNAVNIQFKAGHGDAATDIPKLIIQAIMMLVGHWYEHRENVVVGTITAEVPLAYKFIYISYKVFIL